MNMNIELGKSERYAAQDVVTSNTKIFPTLYENYIFFFKTDH
jgi:hypothetical protein